jgi:predicted ATP-dependent serine protease
MIKLVGGKKEQTVRRWLNEKCGAKVPNGKVLDNFYQFQLDEPDAEISYGSFNAVLKKCLREGHVSEKPEEVEEVEVEPNIIKVEDLDFPDFRLHRSNKKIDDLFSDHEIGGGLYGGTATIVVGESGVGKSTLLLDYLASVQKVNPDAKILYVSSEMTRNDILFYYKKTPSIAKIPTLLLMDYVKSGQLSSVLRKSFNKDYDIIILDSYQDILVKLKEVHNWKATYAEGWLTNMMIESAEKTGSAVLAIQHMTKGGTYVGSTYLKHATTAMMEIRFDKHGGRYVIFSKNRRGGSGTNKPLYFDLDENGDVVYDVERFNETEEINEFSETENIRKQDLNRAFENIFLKETNDLVEDQKPEEDRTTFTINVDSNGEIKE